MWSVHQQGVLIFAPRGPITDKRPEGAAELRRLAEETRQVDREQALLVIADLTDVTCMNSTGLGELITMYIHTSHRGGHFALCCVPPRIANLLEMTKLDLILDTYPTRQAALDALTST